MRVLFLDAYFYPEQIAFSHLEQDIMEGLVKTGHELKVICPTPTRGVSKEISRKYRKIKNETLNGVEVYRFRAPCEGKNPLVRAFRYFWCNIRGVRIGRKTRGADAVFAVSTPPTQGYFAGKLAKKLGVPLIYSLQDVFPDSLVTTGLAAEDSLLYRIGSKIEKKTYARCARIIVLSDTVRQNLLRKGVDENKLVTVNNWIDTDQVRPVPREENRLFDEYGIDKNKFVVVYAGNFGASQGAGVILDAAELLKNDDRIAFVIFGGGSEYEKTRAAAADRGLKNIDIHPLLGQDRVSEVYSLGDIALITCKKGVGKTAMPSKTWSIMACDTPIIASFDTDSELAAVLEKSRAGICVEPENAQALAQAILNASENSGSPTVSPRSYVIDNAAKQIGVERYVTTIDSAL